MEDLIETNQPTEKFNQSYDLAPIEHMLFGSGLMVGSRISNIDTVSKMIEAHEPLDIFFRPKCVSDGGDIEGLNDRRKIKGYFAGITAPFDTASDKYFELYTEGWSPAIELNGVDSQGMVNSQWNISLIKGTEQITNPKKLLQLLPINAEMKELFTLEEGQPKGDDDESRNVLVLKLHQAKVA